ncbi:hypothetical protein AXG93_313s1070 [Marchantia polymorpha subsp. ruderalis]|uniref:DUF4200 domain-containing protein n=1 Tax=Marchantia polymorpha subsp. ruderalis TaxID=1480154 RepID=A0A176VDD4_MARPO|nr:hypothetical protein AXG93_313s1070 [Marchantia polymorpha subsp. ruderalis]
MTVSAASTNVTGTTHSSSSTSEETSPANPDAAPENHVNFDTSTTPPVPMRGISLRSPSQTDMFFKTRTVSEADALIRARTQSQADAFLRALAPDASFLKAPDTFDIEIGPRKSSVGSYLRGDPNALLEEELEYMSEEVQELHEDVEIQKPVVPEDWEKDEVCREWAKDPFVMPDDDRVFRIRDAQRRREKKERREQAAWSVREKTTFASRMGAAVGSEKLRVILRELEKEWENMLLRLNKELPKPALQTVFYHRDEETVLEFVAKKREIFLVQMSLDTRRAEIRKLQDRIFQREEALKKSEGMLEEDSLEFDAFLKRNDAAVQEAVKTAEQETKRRQDKIIEIKKLNSAIATINSDLNKFGEQLDDCKKYKDFLIKLTPKEWFEEQAKIKQQAQELEALKARQLLKSAGDSSTTSDRSKYHGDHDAVSSSPVDDIDDEVEVEETMYFQQPHQVIETAVKNEEERQRMMQSKTSLNTEDKKHDISLEQLTRKVVEVYARAGLDSDASLSTLQMLTNLEAKLEENLLGIDHIPPEYVEQQERIREKERRLKAPIFKRVGKPPMYRVNLVKKKRKPKIDASGIDEEVELAEFLEREY